MNRRSILISLLLIVILALSGSKSLIHLLTEVWWFESVDLTTVFWTRLTWQILIWVVTFAFYSLFLWGNYRLAMHHRGGGRLRWLEGSQLDAYADTFSNYLALAVIFVLAFNVATVSMPAWETVLKFFNASEFALRDPIFQLDVGFYTFKLPLYESLRNWLGVLLVGGLILSALIYGFPSSMDLRRNGRIRPHTHLSDGGRIHLSGLLAAIAMVIAFDFWLRRYSLLYAGGNGVVFGAGYTDVHAILFAFQVMSVLSLMVAVAFLVSIKQGSWGFPLLSLAWCLLIFLIVNGIYPWFQQQFIVAPNELVKEKPYLAHNIQFTQTAYHLHDVQKEDYAAESQLNRQVLQKNQATMQNIRLWDYRPLLSTYRQLQEIRLYYEFLDVDIDRYTFNGNYQQVMLSGRELSFESIPQEAQTWVNQRLKYTHGYGLAMSPVNRVTSDGLPEFYIKDIPPVSPVNLQVSQPAIYYGEGTKSYIFTNTTTEEFDYPLGDSNAFTQYGGKGGVPLSSIWRRLAYAYDLGSIQILISNYFTNQSRIHYYRQIQERVQHVAPFLRFDSDPYLTLIDGKLQWIIDAYTVSNRYPYSEPVVHTDGASALFSGQNLEQLFRGKINYIRNSVKVVLDPYDGSLRFFVVDETDPILATYRQIFPDLFEPSRAIPTEVKAHFRYPFDLLKIQSQMYLSYHMSNPEVFYNREDLWRFPLQTYEGNQQVMEPYYMIMRLPGETQEEFILILPFTPANKDNMIAWLAARSNGKDYGKLLLYEFPKQKLVYGPRQIEARIDQEPKISQQFTLWSQAGSKVIRGDLLVIPIEQSLLYVEPVYLRAEQGELPELKRVIVAYNKEIAMEETLEQSLAAIFGGERVEQKLPRVVGEKGSTLVKSALLTYQKAQQALRQGNWADYGRYQQELEKILQQLNQGSLN
jgi:uncharacterized membrane protein (UPF0182 family)